MEDERIVALFLRRDEAALGLTAAKYGQKLRALADNLLRDRGAAEECENDTYMQAWAAIPPHEPWNYLFPFLAKITRRLAIDVARARSRQKRSAPIMELTSELEQCIPSPNDTPGQADGTLLIELVENFLRSLPEERRNMFIRRYWYLDPVKEVADFFGCSQGRVKTTLYRVRRDLREYLIKEGYDI
ncbi:MAG: RNA polymerase sigma factor [Acutalibacter muris]|nr:RNA polymerase sigma factor [Acutalibacter muris]